MTLEVDPDHRVPLLLRGVDQHLASGQVVELIDDLPTCEQLVDRVVTQAAEELRRTQTYLV